MGKKERPDPLDQLIEASHRDVLGRLVRRLAAEQPQIRRECFEFLKGNVVLDTETESDPEAETAFSLWDELEPDLEDLDNYGGGDYETQDHVAYLLSDLEQILRDPKIQRVNRRAILDEVLPYIQSRNSGMEDPLYDVAYATCHDDEDWRYLAERLEALEQDWPCDHARRIYRRLGDRDKYLALRGRRMEYGADYHDLATFHWECGEREQALAVAWEGLKNAQGRMTELRTFLSDRAKESGDRQTYLELEFSQATSGLTLKDYENFEKLCRAGEWRSYEPRMLKALQEARPEHQLDVLIHRRNYDQALAVLTGMRYPGHSSWDSRRVLDVAARLEEKYPEQILAFYLSGLGNLNVAFSRQIYAHKAGVAKRVRHMWVDVLEQPEKWSAFVKKVRALNSRRPAFRQEFARVLPDWEEL